MKNYTITVNGNVYQVSVEEGTSEVVSTPVIQTPKSATVASMNVAAPTTAPVTKTQPAPVASGGNGNIKVSAPMPGKIIAIKANVGQAIKKGEIIVILEAMKMENELVAPSDGTIASINTTVGASVESGELIATLS